MNYRLTEKGIDLAPVMLELLIWGARHEETVAPVRFIDEMEKNREEVLREVRRRWQAATIRPADSQIRKGGRSANRRRSKDEQRTSTGRHAQGRVRADVGRQTREVGRQRSALRRLGDLSRQGLARGSRTLYASQSSGWFGQVIQRSNDGGKTWEPVGNKFVYDGVPGTHQWYDGTPHPWEFKRVWHLEPSLTDPDTVYAGVEDAAIFQSTDGGKTWQELAGLRGHGSGPQWQPGAGGMCLHTILLDPSDPSRIYIAISAAGAFRTDDGGATWKPINHGLRVASTSPIPTAEVGHCVHRIAMHQSRPNVLFMQKHWDVMRSDDAGD